LTLQVGLTFIAGEHILQASTSFQKTLVSLDQAPTPWEHAYDHAVEHGTDFQKHITGFIVSFQFSL